MTTLRLGGVIHVPLQVPRKLIGTDAFQETPIVEVTRQITKHNYLVMDLDDLPRIVKEVQAQRTLCLTMPTALYQTLNACSPPLILPFADSKLLLRGFTLALHQTCGMSSPRKGPT